MRFLHRKYKILFLVFTALLCSFCVHDDVFAGAIDVYGTGTPAGPNGDLVNQTINIGIQAKVKGGGGLCYDLDLSWGDMKYEYYYGRVWDPKTHTYSNYPDGLSSDGKWIWSEHIDRVNNCINVTNHSNFPMKVDFSFALDGTVMNESPTAAGSVIGIFSNSNDVFTEQLLDEGYRIDDPSNPDQAVDKMTATRILEMDREKLRPGEKYYYKNHGDPYYGTEFFALSGKPDSNRSRSYMKVGTITVTVSPVQDALLEVIP